MPDNSQKTPLARSLNTFAERKISDAIQILGKALPCSVAAIPIAGVPIFEVKFEIQTDFTLPNVTVAMAGAEYIRFPIPVGCKGVVFPAATRLGGVNGLGSGVADLSTPANLSALTFFPLGNSEWTPSAFPNSLDLFGPEGVVVRNADGTILLKVTDDGVEITLPMGKNLIIHSLPTAPSVSGSLWRDVSTGNVKVTP